MLRIIGSIVLVLASLIITEISAGPGDTFRMFLFVVVSIVLTGLSISFLISAWSKGKVINGFKKSLKISFGLASLIHLLGYFLFAINGAI
jgi:hypothetical protein